MCLHVLQPPRTPGMSLPTAAKPVAKPSFSLGPPFSSTATQNQQAEFFLLILVPLYCFEDLRSSFTVVKVGTSRR